jgi:hypothetical protein
MAGEGVTFVIAIRAVPIYKTRQQSSQRLLEVVHALDT